MAKINRQEVVKHNLIAKLNSSCATLEYKRLDSLALNYRPKSTEDFAQYYLALLYLKYKGAYCSEETFSRVLTLISCGEWKKCISGKEGLVLSYRLISLLTFPEIDNIFQNSNQIYERAVLKICRFIEVRV